jgi:hypothetical protein
MAGKKPTMPTHHPIKYTPHQVLVPDTKGDTGDMSGKGDSKTPPYAAPSKPSNKASKPKKGK